MKNVLELFQLKDKVIVATGATGYLCSHFVEAVAQAKGNLAIIDIRCNEEKLKKLQMYLKDTYEVKVKYYIADNSQEEDIEKVSQEVIKDFGKIDGLINAAGINQHGSIQDYTGEDYLRLMNINIVGTFLCCKYFGKYMVEQKSGSIVNIASFTGTIVNKPPFNMSGYCTSKGGVLHLTRSIASEYGEYNVRVNSISP
ncbi:MAG: SDR family NAD(P)-dependent oxidoreductase, partial [Faecalibacillus sp.]